MRYIILLFVTITILTNTQEQNRIVHIKPTLGTLPLITDRCYMRPTKVKEHKQLAKAMSLNDVLCYYLFGKRTSANDAQRSFGKWFNRNTIKLFLKLFNAKNNNPPVWTILDKKTDNILGFVGLHRLYKNVNTALSIYNKNNYNLSLSLFNQYQGYHLSSEVISTFVEAFFNTKKYKKSSGVTFLVNVHNNRALSCFKDPRSNNPRSGIQEQGQFKYKYSQRFTMKGYTLSRKAQEEYSQALKDVNVII